MVPPLVSFRLAEMSRTSMAISTKPAPISATPETPHTGDYGDFFPHSTRAFVEGSNGIRVPFREIALSGGEQPLRVYDTSGPREHDVREGLPALRADWIRARGDVTEAQRSYKPIA